MLNVPARAGFCPVRFIVPVQTLPSNRTVENDHVPAAAGSDGTPGADGLLLPQATNPKTATAANPLNQVMAPRWIVVFGLGDGK
jgi:hypothetical protein